MCNYLVGDGTFEMRCRSKTASSTANAQHDQIRAVVFRHFKDPTARITLLDDGFWTAPKIGFLRKERVQLGQRFRCKNLIDDRGVANFGVGDNVQQRKMSLILLGK